MNISHLKSSLFAIVCMLVVSSCYTSEKAVQYDKDGNMVDANVQGMRQLIDYIRLQPGVEVRGGATNPIAIIRGAKSFSGENEPIYVVDGIIVGNSYREAVSSVDIFNIETVTVVTPPRAGKYGARGQDGVIEITMKKEIRRSL
ncbi:MAG: TonB-dependent receptor plug domain-containing protein [Saprospiraceae bacterium]|nr:TonB-dependent receptor plug domain-containing protein [Saprospiraceae bacterium]